MKQMPFDVAQKELGGTLALAKVNASKTMEYCAREASQIFGGNAYTRTGLGEKVEVKCLYRDHVRAWYWCAVMVDSVLLMGLRLTLWLNRTQAQDDVLVDTGRRSVVD